mmetsp:Transcript_8320/g.17977  ORF Transcript_8320/g.17977 Transcript_8320/m.17977 type:complete len:102 (-) Transcript_8320:45-350(-)
MMRSAREVVSLNDNSPSSDEQNSPTTSYNAEANAPKAMLDGSVSYTDTKKVIPGGATCVDLDLLSSSIYSCRSSCKKMCRETERVGIALHIAFMFSICVLS